MEEGYGRGDEISSQESDLGFGTASLRQEREWVQVGLHKERGTYSQR